GKTPEVRAGKSACRWCEVLPAGAADRAGWYSFPQPDLRPVVTRAATPAAGAVSRSLSGGLTDGGLEEAGQSSDSGRWVHRPEGSGHHQEGTAGRRGDQQERGRVPGRSAEERPEGGRGVPPGRLRGGQEGDPGRRGDQQGGGELAGEVHHRRREGGRRREGVPEGPQGVGEVHKRRVRLPAQEVRGVIGRPNRVAPNIPIGCSVRPCSARSARISPTTEANLNP